MRKYFNWRTLVLASFAIFSACMLAGLSYWSVQTDQWKNYMYGRIAFIGADFPTAIDYFDLSYADYNAMLVTPQDAYTAPPSLELAELSQHFKALSLVNEGTEGAFTQAAKLSQWMDAKIRFDRNLTQQDFEILFHNQPKQAEKQGKGRGQGKEGDKKSDDPENGGNQAGKENREKL